MTDPAQQPEGATSAMVDLPPPPFSIDAHAERLAGASVRAYLLNGGKIAGRLVALNRAGIVRIAVANTGTEVSIPFAELRAVRFAASPTPVAGDHAGGAADSRMVVPSEPQVFEIRYKDGKSVTGHARAFLVDELGHHLFQEDEDGRLLRLFVPNAVVHGFHVGSRIGDALVKAGHAKREQIDAAVRKQEELREQTVGEYLQKEVALNQSDVQQALEHQSRLPARKIGELLVSARLITRDQLEDALSRQRKDRGKRIGDILLDMGAVTGEDLHVTLARNLGIPFVKLKEFDVDADVLKLVSDEIVHKHSLIPLFLHEGRLVVAMEDPTNTEALALLRFTAGRHVEAVVASAGDINWAIDKYYGPKGSAEALEELGLEGFDRDEAESSADEIEQLGQKKPIVKLVNSVILDAIRQKASDIHVRAEEHEVELLFRIDGTLVNIARLDKKLLPALVSRIKILGRMDIAERRLPQDGRTRVSHAGAVVDLRISVIPTVYGESVVIRILDTRAGLKSLDEIGFTDHDKDVLRDLLHKSYGLILVTGPTGSGKSTTLYAALNEVKLQNVNIITVEDPVEYHMDGLEQIHAYTAPGFTFARALRHILRHDPDVIMIGEIRDEETGKIAIESALTGHLVLSTLHTNDAATAVTRLLEMGVESYLLGATLIGALAQRLVRRNCPHCMVEEEIDPMVRRVLKISNEEVFYKGGGCDQCNGTGFGGRVAVYELLPVTEELRDIIKEGVTADEVHRQAISDGMVPLTDQAMALARQRVIPLGEVYRVRLQ